MIGAMLMVASVGCQSNSYKGNGDTGLSSLLERLKVFKRDKPEAQMALQRLNKYADSLGIDTTKYSVAFNPTDPMANEDKASEKLSKLLMELRYGDKIPGLAFHGLRKEEKVDTAWVNAQVTAESISGDALISQVKQSTQFEPYAQLVGHYQQLRGNTSTDTLEAIKRTLNYYRWLNRFDYDRFVVINIPAAELTIYDKSGKRLLPMEVIVGKQDTQTPVFTSHLKDIITYPYWNVPESIATKEILPKMRRNAAFLDSQNMQVVTQAGKEVDPYSIDWAGISADEFVKKYRFRQSTGCDNALGVMKFNLDSPFAIYLHDTNSRELFSTTNDRWRSHGCMRVQKPVELANFLMGSEKFDPGFLDRCMIDQKPRTFPLPKPFPVFIAYNLVDVDDQGKLAFHKDVYKVAK
ncbi:hypothetical protein GCM10023187_08750 [Nibrella viscosa]|uniref:L,D-TPase catalytic domain-containing protein n=2 Tax=Nibrella viscosa TaxID=1084524 RepID=A0ABP8JZD5_9BACT